MIEHPNKNKRIVDLTLPLYPGMRGVAFEPKYHYAEHGWNAQTYHLYSHCGTHLDAPNHYEVNEKSVADWPLERLMGLAWVVNIYGIAPRSLIRVEHLGDVVDQFQAGESLLLNTGWGEKVDSPEYRDALPRISKELALWCAKHGVNMLGVEPPAVADPNNRKEIQSIHKILLGADIIIVEGLCNLNQLQHAKVHFIALPLKIVDGDGSPVRALAIEMDEI